MSDKSGIDILQDAMRLYELADTSNDTQLAKVIELLERAQKGLTDKFSVGCHAMLARIFVIKAIREDDEMLKALRNSGLSASRSAARAMREIEAALKRDATLSDHYFADPESRAIHLHSGFTQYIWLAHAFYIKRSQGSESAISYLQSILSLFEYLNVPVGWWIAGGIAGIYEDSGALDKAVEWFEYSLGCEEVPGNRVQAAKFEDYSKKLLRVRAKMATWSKGEQGQKPQKNGLFGSLFG